MVEEYNQTFFKSKDGIKYTSKTLESTYLNKRPDDSFEYYLCRNCGMGSFEVLGSDHQLETVICCSFCGMYFSVHSG